MSIKTTKTTKVHTITKAGPKDEEGSGFGQTKVDLNQLHLTSRRVNDFLANGSSEPVMVVGVDPGLNGEASDEAHCVFLVKGDHLGVLAGQTVNSETTDDILTPLTQMTRLSDIIGQARRFIRRENIPVLVVVERNLSSTSALVYRQVLYLLRSGLGRDVGRLAGDTANILFAPDVAASGIPDQAIPNTGDDGNNDEGSDTNDDATPAPKRPKNGIGIWTSTPGKAANYILYTKLFGSITDPSLMRQRPILLSPREGEDRFQLGSYQLMELVETQRATYIANNKKRVGGIVQRNDMFMAFTFTLAWITRFMRLTGSARADYIHQARIQEGDAQHSIHRYLEHYNTTTDDTDDSNQNRNQEEGIQTVMTPTLPSPIATITAVPTMNPAFLGLVHGSPVCDAFVAIAAIRYATLHLVKRSSALIKRIIVQRVLIEGWHPPSGYDVRLLVQHQGRISWKDILLTHWPICGTEEQVRGRHGRVSTVFNWYRMTAGPRNTTPWWGSLPSAGCSQEMSSLCKTVEAACTLVRTVIKIHHSNHPLYRLLQEGSMPRDLTVFSRMLEACSQKMYRLSLTFDVDSQRYGNGAPIIRSDKNIRSHLQQHPPLTCINGQPTLSADYTREYFALVAYAQALAYPMPALRASLIAVLGERCRYEVANCHLRLTCRKSRRVPYGTLCKSHIPQPVLTQAIAQQRDRVPQGPPSVRYTVVGC